MTAIRILKIENLSDRIYPLEIATFEKPGQDGKPLTKNSEIYHRPSGAAILLLNTKDKSLLLTRQFRLPVYLSGEENHLYEVCAGITDKGETFKETILREVEEEMGYRLKAVKEIGEAYFSPAGTTEIAHFFIGEYTPDMKIAKGGGKAGEGENIEIIEMPFTEARNKLQQGVFRDAKTIILLQYAIINGLI